MPFVRSSLNFCLLIIICFLVLASCELKSANDYFAAAEQLEMQGKYQEAIKLLDKAIEKDTTFLGAYINRGADKSALNDYKGAIEDYQRVIALDPQNTLAYFNIANNYRRLEEFNLAVNYYNKAFATKGGGPLYIDYVPNNFVDLSAFDVPGYEICYERAIAYYHLDSLNKAYADFQHSIEKGYLTGDCYEWVGYIYISTGQRKQACNYFQKAKFAGNKNAEDDINKYCKD